MDYQLVLGIISVIISGATLIVMVFGFRLGKSALAKNQTFFGLKARERLGIIEKNVLKGREPETYVYGGGGLQIPQLRIEKIKFDPNTMPEKWENCTQIFQFYDRESKDSKDILVKEWVV